TGEIQLTNGLRELLKTRPIYACEVKGVRHDTGNKLGFLKAVVYFALRRPDLAEKFSAYLTSLDLRTPAVKGLMHFSGSGSADQRRLSGACGDDGGNGFHTEKRRKRRRAEESGSTAGLRSRPAGVAGLERIHEPDQIHAGSRIRSIRSRASLRDARRTAITPHASLPRSSPFVSVAPFLCVERCPLSAADRGVATPR